MGGGCARGVVINAGMSGQSIEALFEDTRNLYFFYAPESKPAHAGPWHNEFVAQVPLGAACHGALAEIPAFVHVIGEANVVATWGGFRAFFGGFRSPAAGMPLHYTVRSFVCCMQCEGWGRREGLWATTRLSLVLSSCS